MKAINKVQGRLFILVATCNNNQLKDYRNESEKKMD